MKPSQTDRPNPYALGMDSHPPLHLTLRLDGPMVAEHRLPLSELERMTKQLRAALRDVATVLTDYGPSGTGGRVKRFIEASTDLRVVGSPQAGSFCLDLEAPATSVPEQAMLEIPDAEGLSERTIEAFIVGLSSLSDEIAELPAGFDRGVLMALKPFRTALGRGISKIELATVRDGRRQRETYIDAETIAIAERLIKKPIRAHAVAQGMLQMVDFSRLECRIDRPPQPSVTCVFQEKDRDLMQSAVRQFVRVVGEGEFIPGRDAPTSIVAAKLEVIYESLTLEGKEFWRERSLEDRATERGVKSFSLPEPIDEDPWRDDDEAKALIAAIRNDD